VVQGHDIPATALALLGIIQPMEGRNAWPLVTGEMAAIRDHVVTGWARFSNGRAEARVSVRDDQWNYVVGVGVVFLLEMRFLIFSLTFVKLTRKL
jgi:hypothetical protein